MRCKVISDLNAEHTQEILEIQRNHDVELRKLKYEMTAIKFIANDRENQNLNFLENLKSSPNLTEMAEIKDYHFLR